VAQVGQPTSVPHWLLGIALALPVALVVVVLIVAAQLRDQPPAPVQLAEVSAPAADSADCRRLLANLPDNVDGIEQDTLRRRPLAVPAPTGATAWGEPPVVLRCGLDRPADLTATSRLLAISGVRFLELSSSGRSTWVAVDRPVYIAVDLSPAAGSGSLQQIAAVIADTLPQRTVDIPR
jgi:Protein of unknown function (DUF3515)